MNDVEPEVLRQITPTEDENRKINRAVDELKEKVSAVAEPLGIDVEPILVGSVAKGTHLRNPDLDIFVMFGPDTSREDLERYGLEIGRRVLGGEERYAEHPYIRGKYNDLDVDMVPCYRVEKPSHRMSAVDRTPFHTEYIKEHLQGPQKNDVRLLKQFMKGMGVYSAEAKVQGFSGYLCELLVIRYGGFNDVLKNAVKWRKGTYLFLDRKKPTETNGTINNTHDAPLIFIDPVDESRNVASALVLDKFAIFIHACREFLKTPAIEFFFPRELKTLPPTEIKEELEQRGTRFIAITFPTPDIIQDNLYPQLRKCEKTVVELCSRYGFLPVNSMHFAGQPGEDSVVFIELENDELPPLKKHRGPPLWLKNSFDFYERWRDRDKFGRVYIENGRWAVDTVREHTSVSDLLASKLPSLNLGKNLNEIVGEIDVLAHEEITDTEHIKKYGRQLTTFIDRRFPWER